MFVSYSEIKISVIVKHMQHISIIRAFFLPGWRDLLSFSVPGGGKKNCWVVVCLGGSAPSAPISQKHNGCYMSATRNHENNVPSRLTQHTLVH